MNKTNLFFKYITKLADKLFLSIEEKNRLIMLCFNITGIILVMFINFNLHLRELTLFDSPLTFWTIIFLLIPLIFSFLSSLLVSTFKEKIIYSFHSTKLLIVYILSPFSTVIPYFEVIPVFYFLPFLLIFILILIFIGAIMSFAFNKVNINFREILSKRLVYLITFLSLLLILWEYPALANSLHPSCIIAENGCGWECSDFHYSNAEICSKTVLAITTHYKYCAIDRNAEDCLTERSVNTMNAKGCLTKNTKQWEIENCLYLSTEKKPVLESCNIYPEKNVCYQHLATILKDKKYCDLIENTSLADECYDGVKESDSDSCEKIKNKVQKEHCFFEVKIKEKSLIPLDCDLECANKIVKDIYRERVEWCEGFLEFSWSMDCVKQILDSIRELPNYELIREELKKSNMCLDITVYDRNLDKGVQYKELTEECLKNWI